MKYNVREWQDKPQTGRKYLQKTHLVKDCYTKHTKSFQNSTIRKTNKQKQPDLKIAQRPEQTHQRRTTGINEANEKYVPHHVSSGKCKLKQQNTSIHLLLID